MSDDLDDFDPTEHPETWIDGSMEQGWLNTARICGDNLLIEEWTRSTLYDPPSWYIPGELRVIDLSREAAAKLWPILQRFLAQGG